MDGVYLSLQGEDRKTYGPSREMKVAIAYSGVNEDASKRRTLVNKVACAGFESAEHFRELAEGVIADFYDVSSIEQRIFNSDGANWLQKNMVPNCTYQLDIYHRNQAIIRWLDEPELRRLVFDLLKQKRVKAALDVIEASINSTDDPIQQENRTRLFKYLNAHRSALIPYAERKGKKPPLPNEGQLPAHCGSMESNIFTLLGNHMKDNRACWSQEGANNLASLLMLYHTNSLHKLFGGWKPEREETAILSARDVLPRLEQEKKTAPYEPPHRVCTDNLPACFKNIAKLVPLSDLPF